MAKSNNNSSENTSVENGVDSDLAITAFPKLAAAIQFFIHSMPSKLNRISLCKHLYYADGHFYQKKGVQITELLYLHIEGSPQPIHFNILIHEMVNKNLIQLIPRVEKKVGIDKNPVMVLEGLTYSTDQAVPDIFTREELKVLNSVARQLNGDLSLETRYYPHLYSYYVQTDLYQIIPWQSFMGGKRPHLQWKAWASKIFQLKWQ